MTSIKKIQNLPKLHIEIDLYEISRPIEEKDGTKTYYSNFSYSGVEVTSDDGETNFGSVVSPISGGSFIRINGFEDRREYYLAPDDLWEAVTKAIGWDASMVKKNISKAMAQPIKKAKTFKVPEKKIEKVLDVKTSEPDWDNAGVTFYPRDPEIKRPWITRYPKTGHKRSVSFHLMRHPGYPHTFVTIREEDNPIWNPADHTWAHWTGMPEGLSGRGEFDFDEIVDRELNKGEKTGAEFNSYRHAMAVCKDIVHKYFPEDLYEINWEDYGYDDDREAERDGD
jgi:hypothetical protein